MAMIIKEIRLETTKQNLIQAVIAKQNDCNSRFLKVTFLDEGTAIPVPATAQVTINARRTDGEAKNFFGVVNEDDTATVPLHSWILELDGNVDCDVSILDSDGSKLTTTSFVVIVEKAACSSDDISSDPQYEVLVNLIEEVSQITGDLSDCVKKTDLATNTTPGLVKGTENGDYGIMISQNGDVQIRRATSDDITARKHTSRPIVPANLKQAVTSVFADAANAMVFEFWDGDIWAYDDGTDVSVSVDNLDNVKGNFIGQIIIIKDLGEMIPCAFMYLGTDHQKHYWTALQAL